MSNIIILGAQWGDEGKGKLVDLLADRFDYIVRYQGGNNAGHTILIGDRKFVLRLVPSGILLRGKVAVIGNGLVVDPLALLEEMEQLAAAGVDVDRASCASAIARRFCCRRTGWWRRSPKPARTRRAFRSAPRSKASVPAMRTKPVAAAFA